MSKHVVLTSRHLIYIIIPAWFLVFLLLGCLPAKKLPPPGAEIPLIDASDLAQFIEQNRGKVILIDFWATWCPPCRQLFPHAVELHKRWADRGLVVIGVSLDVPEDGVAVWQFLDEKQAAFANFISRFGPGVKSVMDFGIENGAIPFLRLYDRQGKLLKNFGGGKPIYLQEIDQAVEQALNRE